MNEQVVQFLSGLSEKLGVTVEYLWTALLQQAVINGCLDLFFIIVIAGGGFFGLRGYLQKREEIDRYDVIVFDFFAAIVFVVIVTATIALVYDAAASLLNPAYWAWRQVMPA